MDELFFTNVPTRRMKHDLGDHRSYPDRHTTPRGCGSRSRLAKRAYTRVVAFRSRHGLVLTLFPSLSISACSFGFDAAEFSGGDAGTGDGATASDASDASNPGDASSGDASTPDGTAIDAGPPRVADWRLDEGAGTTINDSSGNGHTGVALGGLWIDGHASVGHALAFDGGPNELVKVLPASDFDRAGNGAAELTLMGWLRRGSPASHQAFVSISYGIKEAMYGLELKSDTVFTYFDGATHVAEATIATGLGEWHHYAATIEGAHVRLYFDGVLVSEGTADAAPRTSTEVLLGGSNWGDRLVGAIDDVRIYRRVLTPAEIAQQVR